MKANELKALGIPNGPALRLAAEWIKSFIADGGDSASIPEKLGNMVADPAAYLNDPAAAALARELYAPAWKQRESPAPWKQWGTDLEPDSVKQLVNACSLPVAEAGALMPGCPSVACWRPIMR